MAILVDIHPTTPQPRLIHQAVEVLRGGGVIVYPTDTVYGLGCDALHSGAVERIVRIKGRDPKKPLSFVCSDLSEASRYARMSNSAYRLMKQHLPGPYTFVLRSTGEVPKWLRSNQKTVGIRIPDHPIPVALARELGGPILSTSANRSGDDIVTEPEELLERFGRDVDMILSVGSMPVLPSSVVSLVDDAPQVLRVGAGSVEGFA